MPEPLIQTARMSTASSGLAPPTSDADSASIRPRNRRLISTATDASVPSTTSPTQSRGASPIPSARIGSVTGRNNAGARIAGSGGNTKPASTGLFEGPWAQSWASVQEFASSLLAVGDTPYESGSEGPGSRSTSQMRRPAWRQASSHDHRSSWGPAPPGGPRRPRLEDVGVGSFAERDAQLKAMRTASVLESHAGVNGGLDVSGKFKKRSSDEDLRASAQDHETEEHLVYIHHVQKTDTYAGIVLRYKCLEDAFRKANGLWSRDNIQVRKWLAIPVDACEVKGRPCDASTFESGQVDLLAPTPDAAPLTQKDDNNDFFSYRGNGKSTEAPKEDEDRPWTHVRWVSIDAFPKPVEIARLSRRDMGYFPPRRKKSLHTVSTLSTPRGSLDGPSVTIHSEPAIGSPGSPASRRDSSLHHRPQFAAYSTSGSASARSRGNSAGDEFKPAWMRRPGGVGSLNRSVKAPGPETDYLNTWTNKHLPGLNIDSLPSMSIMGSESARFGFSATTDEPVPGIVESPFEDGRDVQSTSRQGSGLDKAAATIETWLRGAFAKKPGTPILGPRGRHMAEDGDLIELTDTNSDDGRAGHAPGGFPSNETGLLSSIGHAGSSGMSHSQGATTRGRTLGGGGANKNHKAD